MQVDLTSSDPNGANTLYLRYGSCRAAPATTPPIEVGIQASQVASHSVDDGRHLLCSGARPGGVSAGRRRDAARSSAAVRDHRRLARRGRRQRLCDDRRSPAHNSTRRRSSSWFGPASPNTSRSAIRSWTRRRSSRSSTLPTRRTGFTIVEVINPDGEIAVAPYRYLVDEALPPDVSVALGGPRVIWAGQSGLYGFTHHKPRPTSTFPMSNSSYGMPTTPLNEGVPYLGDHDQCRRGRPMSPTSWSSIVPIDRHQRPHADHRLRLSTLPTAPLDLELPGADLSGRIAARRPDRTARRHRVRIQRDRPRRRR